VEMFEIDNQYANANVPRTIRFTDKLFEDLNSVAEENNISFNMLVLQCCRYALEHLKQNEERNPE
jgi:predicted HicB family RNase H-like nuclease